MELAPSETRPPTWERMLVLFGMRKMTDEEYLERMKEKRDYAVRRIAELEAEEVQQEAEPPESDEQPKTTS